MRIIEPKTHRASSKLAKSSGHNLKFGFIIILATIIIVVVYLLVGLKTAESPVLQQSSQSNSTEKDNPSDSDLEPKTGLRTFSGNEFRLLYDNLLLPNTVKIDIPPVISGNDIADARIRQVAEARGYKIRVNSASVLPFIDGYPLQADVHTNWKKMQSAATNEGLNMTIVSAYRNIEDQRQLFVSRLQAEGVSIANVAAGTADKEIDTILITTAIPGYSKHHSGYTVDLLCQGWAFENFKNSPCHQWLLANNYQNAKKYGFIPSYPMDADLQGPEPEAWEYVYVGSQILNY
jgi:LAS superfamily LD-carboxypeptidase LdcB